MIEESLYGKMNGSEKPSLLCVIGDSVTQYSKSPIMWNAAFEHFRMDAHYGAIDVAPEELRLYLDVLITSPHFLGFNITKPHKEEATQHHLISLDDLANEVGAVNTVNKVDGQVFGYNTDGYGAVRSIKEESGMDSFLGQNVMIIGAGGAGAGVAIPCAQEGGNIYVANRTFEKAERLSENVKNFSDKEGGYEITPLPLKDENQQGYHSDFLDALKDTDIVINTTDAEKQVGPLFTEDELKGKAKVCMDAAYGMGGDSPFIKKARSEGHTCVPGERMLLHQAVKAFEIIFSQTIEERGITTEDITQPMRYAVENLPYDASHKDIYDAVREMESSA